MRRILPLLLLLPPCSAVAQIQTQAAPHYIEREMYLHTPDSEPQGLNVLEVYADRPGKHPLVLITHGSSNNAEENHHITPWSQLPDALWFAQRGYVAIIVVRRGYGRSGGIHAQPPGSGCTAGTYLPLGHWNTIDLNDVIRMAGAWPEVDTHTTVAVGVSAGGTAVTALTAEPSANLKAAISFAGGHGGDGKGNNCALAGVTKDFAYLGQQAGQHGSVPMLWVYSVNDQWFPPAFANQFSAAYKQGGGNEEFVAAPAFHDNGHFLFSSPADWSDTVTAFLKKHDLLPLGDTVLPGPEPPKIAPPVPLSESGLAAWNSFLLNGKFSAFAVLGTHWGVSYGQFDQDVADKAALAHCNPRGDSLGGCTIVARTPKQSGSN